MTNDPKNPPASQPGGGGNTVSVTGNNNTAAGRDIYQNTYGSADPRKQIIDLLKQLKEQAKDNPDAADVLMVAEDAVRDATADQPDPVRVKSRAEKLKQAANDILGIAEPVAKTALLIVTAILGLPH